MRYKKHDLVQTVREFSLDDLKTAGNAILKYRLQMLQDGAVISRSTTIEQEIEWIEEEIRARGGQLCLLNL